MSHRNFSAPERQAQQEQKQNIASLSKVVEQNPRDPEAFNIRGTAYGQIGAHEKALADFNAAIRLEPKFYQAYANRALIYEKLGKVREALADYDRAIEIEPEYAIAYSGRAQLFRKAENTKRRSPITAAP